MLNKLFQYSKLYFNQFVQTVPLHKEGFVFIKKHRPWNSMQQYSWAARVLLVAGIILGYYFFKDTFIFIKNIFENPTQTQASLGAFFTDINFEKIDWAVHGTKKYLVLIVLEIFTFHFIQRTLELQMGRKPDFSFDAFMKAEKRMIKASLFAWIMEIIFTAFAKVILGILGLGALLNDPTTFLIQFYFLGFIIIDNYHECFGLKLKASEKRTRTVAGAAIAVGGVTYLLMYIPMIGVLAATMIGSVTATLAMQRFAPMETVEEFV